MAMEIEAKLKVFSLEVVSTGLKSLGGEKVGEFIQHDCYYSDPDLKLIKTDRGLRLRREKSKKGERYLLTYKGARQRTRFKSRQEIEFEVSDYAKVEQLFGALGFVKRLEFEKRRELWRYGGCEVCLDELPLLGSFVEIEGPGEEAILKAMNSLGLGHIKHIKESYSHMMRDKLDELGGGERQAFFSEV